MTATTRFLSVVATLVALTLSVPAQADVIVTLAPEEGLDLSNVHIGDTLVFNTIASSTLEGEFLIAEPDVHLFSIETPGALEFVSGVLRSTWSNPLDSNPVLASWSFLVTGPGNVELFNGWPDCVGLPMDTTGCAVTNFDASRPADSNHVIFSIQAAQVPEPGSVSLVAVALLLLGAATRRRWKAVG